MSETSSSLPSLKGRRAANSALAGGLLSTGADANPIHIKREISRLYPRLDNIENEINALKQQLPKNLNATIEQIKSDIEKLSKNPEDQGEEKVSQDDLIKQKLEDLESRLQMQLDVSLETSTANLNAKIQELSKTRKRQIPQMHIDASIESAFDGKLESLEKNLENQQKKANERISSIKKTLQKLKETVPGADNSYEQLQALNSDIENNRKNVNELRTRLSELKIQLENQNVREKLQQAQLNAPIAKTNEVIEVTTVPDLTVPLEELRAEVSEMQKKYSEKLAAMKTKAAECEVKVKKMSVVKKKCILKYQDSKQSI